MGTIAAELIEDVIFWEKHTEIYESLEQILNDKYIILSDGKKATREVINVFMSAQMEKADDLRTLESEVAKFNIRKRDEKREYIIS